MAFIASDIVRFPESRGGYGRDGVGEPRRLYESSAPSKMLI